MSGMRRLVDWLGFYWEELVLGRGEVGRWCSIVGCRPVTYVPPRAFWVGPGHYVYRFRRGCGRCGAVDPGSELMPMPPAGA